MGAMKPYPLLDTTMELLAQRGDLTLEQVAQGAGVGYSWLTKLNAGAIPKPGVHPVQKVHDWLLSRVDAAA